VRDPGGRRRDCQKGDKKQMTQKGANWVSTPDESSSCNILKRQETDRKNDRGVQSKTCQGKKGRGKNMGQGNAGIRPVPRDQKVTSPKEAKRTPTSPRADNSVKKARESTNRETRGLVAVSPHPKTGQNKGGVPSKKSARTRKRERVGSPAPLGNGDCPKHEYIAP